MTSKTARLAQKDNEILFDHDLRHSLGRSWASVTPPSAVQNTKAAAFKGRGYVLRSSDIGGDGGLSVVDGADWTSHALTGLDGVIVAAGEKLVIANNDGALYISTDGTTFTESDMGGISGVWMAGAYGNGITALCGTTGIGTATPFAVSADLVTWSVPTEAEFKGFYVTGLAFGNGVFVALSTTHTNRGFVTENGLDCVWICENMRSHTWTAITFHRGRFVAISVADQKIAYSVDGIEWTIKSASKTLPANSFMMAANGVLLIQGSDYLLTSFDGENFIERKLAGTMSGGFFLDGSIFMVGLATGGATATGGVIHRSDV